MFLNICVYAHMYTMGTLVEVRRQLLRVDILASMDPGDHTRVLQQALTSTE